MARLDEKEIRRLGLWGSRRYYYNLEYYPHRLDALTKEEIIEKCKATQNEVVEAGGEAMHRYQLSKEAAKSYDKVDHMTYISYLERERNRGFEIAANSCCDVVL